MPPTKIRGGMRLPKKLVRVVERERACRVARPPQKSRSDFWGPRSSLAHGFPGQTSAVDPSGRPHVVPVCHVWRGGKLYFAAEATSRKVQHLRTHPQVAVVVDVYTEDWGRLVGVVLQGRARVLVSGPEFRRARAWLYHKYPRYPEEAAIGGPQTVTVEVSPVHTASWGVD